MDEEDEEEAAAVAAGRTSRANLLEPGGQPVGTDNEEATNCSETMSTNDDEDYGDERDGQQAVKEEHQQQSRPTSSVRDRLGTPVRVDFDASSGSDLQRRHEGQQRCGRSPCCDDIQQSDSGQAAAAGRGATGELTEGETTTLSLASQAQAPPSYGAATRGDFTCLDASQLNIVSRVSLSQQQLHGSSRILARATGGQLANADPPALTTITRAAPRLPLFASKTIGSGRASARPTTRALMDLSCPSSGSAGDSAEQAGCLASAVAANNGYQQQQPFPGRSSAAACHFGQQQCLSGSASPPARNQFAVLVSQHLNAPPGSQQRQHQIDLGPDNNRAPLGRPSWPQQSGQMAPQLPQQRLLQRPAFGAPINHVISAGASARWQPRTNQYHAGAQQVAGAPSNNNPSAGSVVHNAASVDQVAAARSQQQQLSLNSHAQLAGQSPQTQEPAATKADANANIRTAVHQAGIMGAWLQASFNGQSAAANRSAVSGGGDTSAIGAGAPEAKNNDGNTSSRKELAPLPSAHGGFINVISGGALSWQNGGHQRGASLVCAAGERQAQAPPPGPGSLATRSSALGWSDENLERSSRKHQQAHSRKRRRHRSTSGRGVRSPEDALASSGVSAVGADATPNTMGAGGARPGGLVPLRASADASGAGGSHKQAISAHCWLIDTSDDQTYACAAQLNGGERCQHATNSDQRRMQRPQAAHSGQHLTVAMMRQTQNQQRQQQPSGQPSDSAARYLTLPEAQLYGQDLTTSLRTNSLKMERILDRNHSASTLAGSRRRRRKQSTVLMSREDNCPGRRGRQAATCSGASTRRQSATSPSSSSSLSPCRAPTARPAPDELDCATVAASSGWSTTSAGGADGNRHQHNNSSSSRAGTLVRLSALLAMVGGLVKRGPRCLRTVGSSSPNSLGAGQRAPANSLSGSAPAGGSQAAAYTAVSLVASSSSSTSAYATGSSHLSSSNLSNRSRALQSDNNGSGPISLAQFALRAPSLLSGTSNVSTTGSSSLFYSSAGGNSAFGQAPLGSHAYEYCDSSVANATLVEDRETQFGAVVAATEAGRLSRNCKEKLSAKEKQGVNAAAISLADSAASSDSGSQTSVGSSQTQAAQALVGPNAKMSKGATRARQATAAEANESRLAHLIMSDHELISAGSDLNQNELVGGQGLRGCPLRAIGQLGARRSPGGLPAVVGSVVQPATASARRRWWWISLKVAWLRRPCTSGAGGNDSDSGAIGVATVANGRHASGRSQTSEAAARYRSLRSTTNRGGRRRQNPSTLQNVLSLAKADRVFRMRLIASIIVSCILLGLICLLASLVYSRSANQRASKLSLMIDDSDYDLSWLWPQTPGSRLQAPELISNKAGNKGPANLPSRYKSWPESSPAAQLASGGRLRFGGRGDGQQHQQHGGQLDNSLRAQLMLIERSERLNQFQLTMTHLTNIQLADDNFIDITQLARHLAAPNSSQQQSGDQASQYEQQQKQPTAAETGRSAAQSNFVVPNLDFQSQNSSDQPYQQSFSSRMGDTIKASNSLPASPSLQLNEADHDLVSLTLLSNLHWPLVKWRHQSQKSVANFLSFGASHSVSFGGTQTMKNLLALIMLAESMGTTNSPTGADFDASNLRQFARLNSLLRSTSYHVISCSYSLLQSTPTQIEGSLSLREKFCRLLIAKYKRMMLTLSQLEHHHLAKLHNPMEPVGATLSGDRQRQQSRSSSRTLLGFFLDRLSLLDISSLVESTLASEELSPASNDDDDGDGEYHSSINSITELLRQESVPISIDPTETNNSYSNNLKWQSKGSLPSFYDFAKLVIGEGPLKLNLSLESNREFQLKQFQQLETNNHDAWRELLTHDLLYPWSSLKLPQYAKPLSYDLFIHPNLTTRLVLGMVKIELKITKPTSFLVLNCDKLNLVDVSVWQKQAATVTANQSAAAHQQQEPNVLKQVPIRRVLTSAKFEQIYIELHDQIEPLATTNDILMVPTTSTNNIRQQRQQDDQVQSAAGLNFGELPLRDVAPKENRFVINISFNKTSLMVGSLLASAGQREFGLEFVQYGDYFAQPEAEVKTILYTQFEPSNARRLFPCFDEPQFKAKFQLNLVHEQNHQVLFNGPKRERVPYTSDGLIQMSVFEQTPLPLSSYLVAFVVCDLQNIKSITSRAVQFQQLPTTTNQPTRVANSGDLGIRQHQQQTGEQRHIQVQILAQFEQLGQTEFAGQLVPQLLDFYQSHLQFAFPLEKLDLIAIPKALQSNQMSSGSPSLSLFGASQSQQQQGADTMENMGLIWFKAPLLLLDTNLISQNLIEQIAMIIAHQIAHQYFGNIVSVRSWQDVWLYESLCQYLEAIALSHVQADWRLEEQFVVDQIQETLAMEQFVDPAATMLLPDSQQALFDWLASSSNYSAEAGGGEPSLTDSSGESSGLVTEQQLSARAGSLDGSKSSDSTTIPAGQAANASSAPPPTAAGGGGSYLDKSQAPNMALDQLTADLLATDASSSAGRIQTAADNLAPGGQLSGAKSAIGLSPNELKRSSALLHMLLFNLLPSSEAQARLLRRCLVRYRYRTMSRRQFWRQFGQQLAREASFDRLSLDWPQMAAAAPPPTAPVGPALALTVDESRTAHSSSAQQTMVASNLTLAAAEGPQQQAPTLDPPDSGGPLLALGQMQGSPSERIVFVRPSAASVRASQAQQQRRSRPAKQGQPAINSPHANRGDNASFPDEELHAGATIPSDQAVAGQHQQARVQRAPRSNPIDRLELVAGAWLGQRGYPLISASVHRDRVQLRQERFSFAWWNEPSISEDDETETFQLKWPSSHSLAPYPEDSMMADSPQPPSGGESSSPRITRSSASASTILASPETDARVEQQQVLAEEQVWPVPLMFVSRFNPKIARFFWMSKRQMELPLNVELGSSSSSSAQLDFSSATAPMAELDGGFRSTKASHSFWFKLNANQSSLVRVNYDERNWEALTELLAKSHYSNHLLSALDRANLIDDSLTLMRCGKLSVGIAMNLTLYLEVGEREYVPWTSALRHLDQMQTLLNQNPLWHRYVLKLIQPISSVIGWKDDGPHLMRKLRRGLFSVALQYGDEKILAKAKQEFKGWLKNGRFIVPNLQELVYVAGVRYGDQQEWFHCWQKYQQLVAIDLSAIGGGNRILGSTTGNTENSYLTSSPFALMPNQTSYNLVGNYYDERQSTSQLTNAAAAVASFARSLTSSSSPNGGLIGEPNEPNAENEKRQLLTALASTQNTWLLEQFLNYSLDSSKIQQHHLKHVMQTLGKNPVARLYLWRFVRLNWFTLADRYLTTLGHDEQQHDDPLLSTATSVETRRGQSNAGQYQVLETMVLESTKHFATKLDYEEVKTFFDGKRRQYHRQRSNFNAERGPAVGAWAPSLEKAIQESLQVIRSNIYWRDFIEPKLTKWLAHYGNTM